MPTATGAIRKASRALLLLLVGLSTTARAADKASVTYATASHAFLSVGHADGIQNGDVLHVQISARTKLPCTVDAVADHHARCRGDSIPKGAFFAILHPPQAQPTVHAAEGSFVPFTQGEIHRVQTRLAATPVNVVKFDGGVAALRTSGFARASHNAYFWVGTQPRSVQAERLDLGAYAAPFSSFPDVTLALRMTALFFTQSQLPWTGASQVLRFLPGQNAQFFVWQGEVAKRGRQNHLVWAAGRLLPWYVPGIALLDGAQVGYRGDNGSFEIGVFGGTAPNMQTTAPNINHGIAGLYAMQQSSLGGGWLLANSARLATQLLVLNQSSLELEARSEITHGTAFQLGVTPRVGYFFGTGTVDLEALRGDISANYRNVVRAYATGRYANDEVDIADALYGPVGNLRSTFYGDSILEVLPISALSVGGVAAWARDNHLPADHISVGPQIGLPHLFGRYGGANILYLYETGTYPAYSIYAQAHLEPTDTTRVWLRSSFVTDTFQTISTLNEVSYYARVEADLTPWMHLGANVRVNQGLYNANVPNTPPLIILGAVQLTATL